jgi:hypothetical protein
MTANAVTNSKQTERRFHTVLIHPYHQEIDQRRRREERVAIARQRQIAEAGRAPRSVRRAVGHSMIRIGSRLASDPARQRARSF